MESPLADHLIKTHVRIIWSDRYHLESNKDQQNQGKQAIKKIIDACSESIKQHFDPSEWNKASLYLLSYLRMYIFTLEDSEETLNEYSQAVEKIKNAATIERQDYLQKRQQLLSTQPNSSFWQKLLYTPPFDPQQLFPWMDPPLANDLFFELYKISPKRQNLDWALLQTSHNGELIKKHYADENIKLLSISHLCLLITHMGHQLLEDNRDISMNDIASLNPLQLQAFILQPTLKLDAVRNMGLQKLKCDALGLLDTCQATDAALNERFLYKMIAGPWHGINANERLIEIQQQPWLLEWHLLWQHDSNSPWATLRNPWLIFATKYLTLALGYSFFFLFYLYYFLDASHFLLIKNEENIMKKQLKTTSSISSPSLFDKHAHLIWYMIYTGLLLYFVFLPQQNLMLCALSFTWAQVFLYVLEDIMEKMNQDFGLLLYIPAPLMGWKLESLLQMLLTMVSSPHASLGLITLLYSIPTLLLWHLRGVQQKAVLRHYLERQLAVSPGNCETPLPSACLNNTTGNANHSGCSQPQDTDNVLEFDDDDRRHQATVQQE